jgi:hypothetical protein
VFDECEGATLSLVIAWLDRRASIPETAVMESRGRGVLDTPHVRGMTTVAEERSDEATRPLLQKVSSRQKFIP